MTRDVVLFTVGLGLTIHEAVFYDGPDRWGLIVLFAGMMGLPSVIRFDELRRAQRDDEP